MNVPPAEFGSHLARADQLLPAEIGIPFALHHPREPQPVSDTKVSRTAMATAYMRAAHQLFDAPPRILEDPIAPLLLGPDGLRRIRDSADSYQTTELRALRAHVALRSRFAEDRLAAAVGRGVKQYVVLGAGFDTFIARQPAWARGLRILEVDQLGTQDRKRAQLAAAGLATPANVEFASIDFENESLGEVLRKHHIAMDEPAFFSWLGVTMYLEEGAIDAVLRSVVAFPPGSEIALTFASLPQDSPSPFELRAANLGEPWVSYFEPEALEAKLRGLGFASVELLSPADAKDRYFRPCAEDFPAPKRANILCATR